MVAPVEQDPEVEDLENRCFGELLDSCKLMANEAGVNYTSGKSWSHKKSQIHT